MEIVDARGKADHLPGADCHRDVVARIGEKGCSLLRIERIVEDIGCHMGEDLRFVASQNAHLDHGAIASQSPPGIRSSPSTPKFQT